MKEDLFNINPDSRMDIKERLLYNILQEIIKINDKIDNHINSLDKNTSKPILNIKNKKI